MSAEIDSLDCLNVEILNSYIELEPGVKDFSFINELFNLFASATPEFIEKLSAAHQENDVKALMYFAHKLKGSAANLGLNRMVKACLIIELDAKSGKVTDSAQVQEVPKYFKQSVAALKLFLQK